MNRIFAFVILSLCALSCNRQSDKSGDSIIAEAGNEILKRSELESGLPKGLNKEDSIIASENYIRLWARDVLMYDIAQKNIADEAEIEKLVESYRKSLIIYQYQEQLVNEKLSKEITEDEMKKYYEENSERFKLDVVLIKGLFLKISVDAPEINKIKEWYKSTSQSSIENIEKYSVQNAVIYDYFYDHWVDFDEVMDNMPGNYPDPVRTINQSKQIELQDSSFYYFLNIKEYLSPGDIAPFEYAKTTVKEILINQRKMDFLKKVEDDLYNTALKKGKIKYNKE